MSDYAIPIGINSLCICKSTIILFICQLHPDSTLYSDCNLDLGLPYMRKLRRRPLGLWRRWCSYVRSLFIGLCQYGVGEVNSPVPPQAGHGL